MPHIPGHSPTPDPVKMDGHSALLKKMGQERLSLRNWEFEPKKILKILTGMEAEVDERTRQLVLTGPAGRAGRAK